MMAKELSGIGIAAVSIGGILIYGGIKGYSPLKALQNIIQGKPGSIGQKQIAFTTGGTNDTAGTGQSIAGIGGGGHLLSDSEITRLWIAEGGNPAKVNIARCIARAESGGDAKITSSNPDGGTNVGLYQLDTRGKGAGYTVQQLQDPALNTRVAIRGSSNGNDWSAWATAGGCGV
jgi:hypothetical protein